MKYRKLLHFLQNIGKDPDTLTFEDACTGLGNRRHLFRLFETGIDWRNLHDNPVCLLMIGIANLEPINEEHGRDTANAMLVHAAEIISASARGNGPAVRYSTSEFVLVLAGKKKTDGLRIARSLVSEFEANPFFSAETGVTIPLSVAVGVAGGPDDADNGGNLMARADAALYHARKDPGGIVDASDADRLAIRHVHNAGIVGRKSQFDTISRAFKELARGRNQFFIIDGEPGMGKTSFIDALQRNLEKTRLKPVRVNGIPQEAFRPYYLISYIIIRLMNMRSDKGVEIVESTGKNDLSCLLHIIPQFTEEKMHLPAGDFPDKAKTVYSAVKRLLARLLDNRTLVLLIDDCHLADPASLDILHELMVYGQSPLFVCATASSGEKPQSRSVPMSLFRAAYTETLGIKNIDLPPLDARDIKQYFTLVFPGIRLPEGLSEHLARLTGGSPLFLAAIIIKMIEDRKVFQSGGRWMAAEPDFEYFPGSFDQMIRETIDGFERHNKQFIDHVSAFGESTSLSMLEGFSRQDSCQVYEILKKAVNQGLMRHEFAENDESIRFSSKLVRKIIYDRIGEEEKKQLHEALGRYHEKLYFQNVLSSPAFLVHHFRRAGNMEKVRVYEKLMARYSEGTYNPDTPEAALPGPEKTDETGAEKEIATTPLSEAGLSIMPELLHTLSVAIRNIRLYPENSDPVRSVIGRLANLFSEIMTTDEGISIMVEKNSLLINSCPVDTTAFSVAAGKIVGLWNRAELKSLTIKPHFSENELFIAVHQISIMEKKAVTPGFWKKFTAGNKLVHIIPIQMRYAKVASGDETSGRTAPPVSGAISEYPVSMEESFREKAHHPFDENEKETIQRIIRSLLSAFNTIRLYPSRGRVATRAALQVVRELQAFLRTRPVFSVARVDERLLVNGMKIDVSGFENTAGGFLKMLSEAALSSVTLTKRTRTGEVVDFLRAVYQFPGPDPPDPDYWQKMTAQKPIAGILLNDSRYEVLPAKGKNEQSPGEAAEKTEKPPQPADWSDRDIPARARELYLKGEMQKLGEMLDRIVEAYMVADNRERLHIISLFNKMGYPEDWHPGAGYIKRITNHFIRLTEIRGEAEAPEKMLDLCHKLAQTLILFGEHSTAARVYMRARERFSAFSPGTDDEIHTAGNARNIRIIGRRLSPHVTSVITGDLKSGDRTRQQEAYQLISSMGKSMMPLLIEIIRESRDFRVPQLAASLIDKNDRRCIQQIKDSLLDTWYPDEKCRILDVIDTVTTDLEDELAQVLSDPDENVRRSAFRLVERLNRPGPLALAKASAESGDARLAIPAIRCLAKLQPTFFKETLSRVLQESGDAEILVTACRAAGKTGDPGFIPALTAILFPKRRLIRRKKFSAPVRVAAVFALARMPDEKAASFMSALTKDPDARIRQVALRHRAPSISDNA